MRSGLLTCLVCLTWGTVALGAEPVKAAPIPPGMKDVPREMKQYVVAFVLPGASYTADDGPERRALLDRHRAFIRRLIEERKLRLAGPFADEGPMFGLTIVAARSPEEAQGWLADDPAVQAGIFRYETHLAFLPSLEKLQIRF
jgi:uncharacterized protein YciI